MAASTHKLRRSVERGMLQVLAPFGFEITDDVSHHRGDSLTIANQSVRLVISADWLDGTVIVDVHTADGRSLGLESVIDLPKGAGLARLSRGVTVRSLGDRLASIAEALESQASNLLVGDE